MLSGRRRVHAQVLPGAGRREKPSRLPGRPAGARRRPDGPGPPDRRACIRRSNSDLLLMGAFLHDIGKIDELAYDRDFAYTDEGQLIGHLVMAVGMLDRKIAEAEKLSGEPMPDRAGAAAEAHDRQPSWAVRVRQPQAADDARGRGPAPARQSRRQDAQFRAVDASTIRTSAALGPTSTRAWAASCSRARPRPSAGRPSENGQ